VAVRTAQAHRWVGAPENELVPAKAGV
jgi:hypothetical protein